VPWTDPITKKDTPLDPIMLSIMAANEHSGQLISRLLERQRKIAPELIEGNSWGEERIAQILKEGVGVSAAHQKPQRATHTTEFFSPDGSSYKLTPLEYAINVGSGISIVEELLRGGCDPSYTESTVEIGGSPIPLSPLVRAAMLGRTDLVS
jgi:hypothetical protein